MLSQRSIQALTRLRTYTPPPTQWYNCPVNRRAAVLILLFPDRNGELKVVLTMRAATLRSYAGQAALPGGKSDTPTEPPIHTARREAYEEIGLPLSDAKLQAAGFKVEHLCELPANLARTGVGVRPCVAFLCPEGTSSLGKEDEEGVKESDGAKGEKRRRKRGSSVVEEKMIPRLDPKEVAEVFTASFYGFLGREVVEEEEGGEEEEEEEVTTRSNHDEHDHDHDLGNENKDANVENENDDAHVQQQQPKKEKEKKKKKNPPLTTQPQPQPFYNGTWTQFHDKKWRMHSFYIPRSPPPSSPPSPSTQNTPQNQYHRVFGMTARILVDAARIAYDEAPAFEFNEEVGDEELIEGWLGEEIGMEGKGNGRL
ncbi:hypothetical protein DM02DRAFT_608141 [Periconia macrospinosa]|uniref:Nudix hydrolase domain-containing protein n=1 Tax=Periconia macrospinosa TaxID=97972 RepID=A0A2V1EBR0_9PLEO|nr:hypothetical protein DM02DRAFT_608141 [Periconia macrospinosa]